jgi:hypothetical protein
VDNGNAPRGGIENQKVREEAESVRRQVRRGRILDTSNLKTLLAPEREDLEKTSAFVREYIPDMNAG